MTLAVTLLLLDIVVSSTCVNQLFAAMIVSGEVITSDVGHRHCDENLCQTIVDGCLSKNQCQCDFRNNALCAKDCIDCLEDKFGKCCACVGLCPAISSDLHTSHVGATSASDSQLFEVLTENDDIKGRWTVIHTNISLHSEYDSTNVTTIVNSKAETNELKCIAAFVSRPISIAKCKKSCTSMGASFFRWFHNGCCECIGEYCLNYGFNEASFGILSRAIIKPTCLVIPVRTIKDWPEAKANVHVIMPSKLEDRLLPAVNITPTVVPTGVVMPMKYPRAYNDMRGPERIHNQLIYGQYGMIALGGGALAGAHFNVIRDTLNKFLNTERFFAVWRVDPPWKAVSKKSLGKRMGGGKAKVHHYETPIRAGRVIIEVAGIGEFGEVERTLKNICNKLPIYAMPISQKIMDDIKAEKIELDAKNYNPFEYRYLLRKNFSNSLTKIYPGEMLWGGTYF